MAQCPKCDQEIGKSTYCGCGWRGRRQVADNPQDLHANAFVDCAHQECRLPAMCKIHTKTGWASLCKKHYDQHFADEAHANLDKYGLAKEPDETTKEHVARMKAFVFAGRKRLAMRKAA
jgi:hypothetical protein